MNSEECENEGGWTIQKNRRRCSVLSSSAPTELDCPEKCGSVKENARKSRASNETLESRSWHKVEIPSKKLLLLLEDGFESIQKEIKKMLEADLKTERIRDSGTSFQHLRFVFRDDYDYGLRDYWINHVFDVNGRNLISTKKALLDDSIRRGFIQQFYAMREEAIKNHDKKHADSCALQINNLVETRNHPLDKLDLLQVSQLKFDLHYFTTAGAEHFVAKLVVAMRNSEKHLINSAEDVHLVTGHGESRAEGSSSIRNRLLRIYEGCIALDTTNRGVLILKLAQKPLDY